MLNIDGERPLPFRQVNSPNVGLTIADVTEAAPTAMEVVYAKPRGSFEAITPPTKGIRVTLPTPTAAQEPQHPSDREVQCAVWTDDAKVLRDLGLAVLMLDESGRPISYQDLWGQRRVAVTSNFMLTFSNTLNFVALGLVTNNLLLVEAPRDCFDIYGQPRFPDTVEFRESDDSPSTLRIYSATRPLEPGEVTWKSCKFVTGRDFIPLVGGNIVIPKTKRVAQAPKWVTDISLNSNLAETYE